MSVYINLDVFFVTAIKYINDYASTMLTWTSSSMEMRTVIIATKLT